jgi:hypothetical protein
VSDTGSLFRPVGTLDVNSPSGYLFFPLVQNVTERVGGDPSARLLSVQGADVELVFQQGVFPDALPADIAANSKLTHAFSGSIAAGDITAFAFEVVASNMITAINDNVSLEPDGSQTFTLTAKVTVFGEMDGRTVDSEEFEYPITVCDGCLKFNIGACEGLDPAFPIAPGFPCVNHYQDEVVHCCTTSGGIELCPAVALSE